MAYVCFNCKKSIWRGSRSQHHKGVAGGSWKHKAQKSLKIFRPNLHSLRVVLEGTVQRIKLCTDCISLLRNRRLTQVKMATRTISPQSTK